MVNRPKGHAGVVPAQFAVFERYRRQLHTYLARRLRRPADVDDLAQEVYLRLLRIDDDKCIDKPLQYLYGLAGHVLADFRLAVERDERHVAIDSEVLQARSEQADDASADELVNHLALQQELERALARLPPMHALVLVAHKREGHSYEEVARLYNLSPHTVNKYVTEARKWMRALLSENQE